ncbi:DUF692 domain-containing protein [Synechococcus sp. CS-1328]|uniref:DUF692 domain-containing protein n=1 Tax=Synechococcus sp. CS-1328 TaxID=2847976 RepID=UPI00223BBCEA|nr:DUF692 domain-containing protein [Synechococcus sp. CS-1328]MCT0225787.1 DUF692 domain-containing protein [Synechococcus sp. CS-1328]MCT0225814.1 DUF692 domain-containing protein [Synechococcus sp. CS-1328]
MLPPRSAGLNLCHENAYELAEQLPQLDFLQIHPEHLLGEPGGVYRQQLDALRAHYPVTLHGFGLSLGSVAPLQSRYLQVVRDLLREHPEAFFSDHVSWSSLSHHHFHDLLPLIYSQESLDHLCDRIDQVQEAIDQPLHIENISSYMRFEASTMEEPEFINAAAARTGAFILLDLNNLWANAMNFAEDPTTVLRSYSPDRVGSYHLAGCSSEAHPHGTVYIDYHREAVHPEVWQLYDVALELIGPHPTLLEWENDVPPLARTLEEVELVRQRLHTCQSVR